MENQVRLPSELCDRIFAHEFEIDTGNLTEELLTKIVQLYVVRHQSHRKQYHFIHRLLQKKVKKTALMQLHILKERNSISKKSKDSLSNRKFRSV